MIQEERIMVLSDSTPRAGAYVLYWMQAAHRVDANHALAYAVQEANRLGLPVLAYFGLAPSYPGAAWRHYHFMLEGLKEAGESLDTLGIKLVIRPETRSMVFGNSQRTPPSSWWTPATFACTVNGCRVHGKRSAAPSSGLNRMPSSRS